MIFSNQTKSLVLAVLVEYIEMADIKTVINIH